MRFDQIARRMVLHAATLLLILTLLSVLVQLDRVVVTPLVGLLSITALYHPVYTLVHRLAKNAFQKQRPVDALHQANARLGTTLETPQLATIIREGLQAACDHPPLAIYVQDQASGQQGYRMTAEGLEVPEHIDFVQLEAIWGNQPDVLPAVAVQQMAQQTLAPELAALIYHPSITLWGIMRHGQGHSIGLIVLGPRRDLDPYRERDLVELCQTLAATSLAFTNSLSYREQVEAEATIRHLYHAVQFEHERTAAAIAREIHDEALNVNLRLNIQAIQRLIAEVRDPILRTKLVRILESAQALSQMLRLICEQLQPTSFDDPLGLTLSLRRHIEQIQALWDDTIAFDIEHEPVPVSPLVHHELVRIAQEALINAVKHAEATRIAVHLRFPAQPGEPLTLAITDNGRTQQAIAPQRGHWGLRYMQESADNIGGSMYWERCIGGGTCVAVIVPNLLHADPIEGDKPENHANPAYTHAS
jgi:signal transduction histidine kinase